MPLVDGAKPRTFVIHFDGDVAASAVEHLRIEVTAVLTMAQPQDEVVVCIGEPREGWCTATDWLPRK